ncbi:acyl-CoA N-acyltransferase, partial [Atractiella rhizophila]
MASMAHEAAWSCDGKKAMKLTLSRAKNSARSLQGEDKELLASFHPTFVYPIFGQEELIPGYKGLEIDLRMVSGSLKMYLNVTYDKALPNYDASGIERSLYDFIPPSYLKNLEDFEALLESEEKEFKPVGERIGCYRPGKEATDARWEFAYAPEGEAWDEEVVYEAYLATAKTPGWLELHRRMQFFVQLEIEGGTYIEEEDDRWEFVALYEKRKIFSTSDVAYHLVGYTTLYRFHFWPDSTRLRLAQFIITPPHQGTGHGSALYNLVYRHVLIRNEIKELTVEDPSEAFADMRDKTDLRNLRSFGVFEGFDKKLLKDRAKVEEWQETQRLKWKMGR